RSRMDSGFTLTPAGVLGSAFSPTDDVLRIVVLRATHRVTSGADPGFVARWTFASTPRGTRAVRALPWRCERFVRLALNFMWCGYENHRVDGAGDGRRT